MKKNTQFSTIASILLHLSVIFINPKYHACPSSWMRLGLGCLYDEAVTEIYIHSPSSSSSSGDTKVCYRRCRCASLDVIRLLRSIILYTHGGVLRHHRPPSWLAGDPMKRQVARSSSPPLAWAGGRGPRSRRVVCRS